MRKFLRRNWPLVACVFVAYLILELTGWDGYGPRP